MDFGGHGILVFCFSLGQGGGTVIPSNVLYIPGVLGV